MARIELSGIINKTHDLINSLGHVVVDLMPRGKVMGYIRAPLLLRSEDLTGFKVFSKEEIISNPKYWHIADVQASMYYMLTPLHHQPMVTFEICQTRGGERLYRPTNPLQGLYRSMLLNLFSPPDIQDGEVNE